MLEIGLMQGRLTEPKGRGIQFFPHGPGEWEKEFELAPVAGISYIQWVCDLESPLFSPEGQRAIREVIEKTGVKVRNMDLHEVLTKTDISSYPDEVFEKICAALSSIQGGTVELPLLESSSLLPVETREARILALERFKKVAEKYRTPIAIETDLPPSDLAALVERFPDITIAYDTGNSAGLGYSAEEELRAYGTQVSNVHIKDKPVGGMTVPLGEGSVDFAKVFSLLGAIPYTGAVTLQAARREEGKEVETIRDYVSFIQKGWEAARNKNA